MSIGKEILKTRWDSSKSEEIPLYWVEGGALVYAALTEWETKNLFVNGFRKNPDGHMEMRDGFVARTIARNTSIGGLG